ncbi:MAG: hypothetical protein M3352_03140, partial [Bacteroidota bacterium]|nr:hypothetical protein [Bacteroidota bacterium]
MKHHSFNIFSSKYCKAINCFFLFIPFLVFAQKQDVQTPDKIWGKLFEEVQLKRIFPDNKTFVDAVSKHSPDIILKKYESEKTKDSPTFDLKAFVTENFTLPVVPSVKVKEGLSLKAHLEQLWQVLQRRADIKQPNSSLLPLPKPY